MARQKQWHIDYFQEIIVGEKKTSIGVHLTALISEQCQQCQTEERREK